LRCTTLGVRRLDCDLNGSKRRRKPVLLEFVFAKSNFWRQKLGSVKTPATYPRCPDERRTYAPII